MLYAIMKAATAVVCGLLFRLEGRGAENVPKTGPVLVVTNHSSVLDPPAVGALVPRPLYYLAKAELFRIPLFGRLIHALHARPVRRDAADPTALRTALRVLEGGGALLVFPEATRQPEGRLGRGRPGAGMLALLSGAPVVPAYVSGTGRAWPKGRRLPRPAKVRVHFGKPMHFDWRPERDRKEQYAAASHGMMAAIATLMDGAK
ncbi:MAG: 1-acyl-sn-glycerol-3-phosphate acyltransferase [Candidatus Rokuibacteriota bacterium]|nr:MAG: 1-acyl-sn-glycerol-3-phosphate acyltransferase [Candidatus Rokubacteria bacterium]PYM79914.1 MAG: 1-acyl-sn-glycerol-3-phosphate acyltransferase [Candidatus Rokubacteria bacterium]